MDSGFFWFRFDFVWGHTRWCSGIILGSALRNLSQKCSEDHMRIQGLNLGWLQVSYLLYSLSDPGLEIFNI